MKTTPPRGLILAVVFFGILIFAALLFFIVTFEWQHGEMPPTSTAQGRGTFSPTTLLWLLVVAGGPALIGVALAYGIMKRRTLTGGERAAEHDAVDKLYDRKH